MAQTKEKFVDLYAPDGTQVEVSEERAEILKGRGYTKSKPRNPTGPAAKTGDQSAELDALREQLAATEKERDEALKAATTPAADSKK